MELFKEQYKNVAKLVKPFLHKGEGQQARLARVFQGEYETALTCEAVRRNKLKGCLESSAAPHGLIIPL